MLQVVATTVHYEPPLYLVALVLILYGLWLFLTNSRGT